MALDSQRMTYEQSGSNTGTIYQKYVGLAAGDNELVALVSNKQVQVMALILSSGTKQTVTFKSGADTIMVFDLDDSRPVSLLSPNDEKPIFWGSLNARAMK